MENDFGVCARVYITCIVLSGSNCFKLDDDIDVVMDQQISIDFVLYRVCAFVTFFFFSMQKNICYTFDSFSIMKMYFLLFTLFYH